MISVGEAHRIIRAALPAPEKELVSSGALAGRVLAQDILAGWPQPRFTNSAMDGFAVRAGDLEGANWAHPVSLKLVGVAAAGQPGDLQVGPGECAQIMTGAPLPGGADAVVMVERTSGYEDSPVQIYHAAQVGDHVRQAGEEVNEGQRLIPAGTGIGPGELGTIATFGLAEVAVYRRPRVGIFSTGDELQEPGEPLAPGQIYNANLPVLRQLAELAGAEVSVAQVVRDDPAVLRSFMGRALDSCDVVMASGGVSMGRFDHVRPVMTELGVKELFWKVAQKPGKPFFFGKGPRGIVFGLPGNPVSSFIVFMEYIWPVLGRIQGMAPAQKTSAWLTAPFPVEQDRHRFLFGRIQVEGGRLLAAPTEKWGSHMLTSALHVNAILEAPPGGVSLSEGELVTVNPLPWAAIDLPAERP